MRRSLAFSLALLGAAALPLPQPAAGGAEAPTELTIHRDFTIAADPSVEVLQVVYRGDTTGRETQYTLFGDGRFVVEKFDRSGHVLERGETTLAFADMRSLVGIAVEHGLVDADPHAVLERIDAALPPGSSPGTLVKDGSTMVVAIELADYVRDGKHFGAVSKRFALANPKIMHRAAPEMPEPVGLVRLGERLAELRRSLPRGSER